MSNRKENIKKSLGISEYPWSSDDDEDNNATQVYPDMNVLHRQNTAPRPSVSDMPGTSGLTQSSLAPHSQTPAPQASQARMDRDLFWSLLNNPRRLSSVELTRLQDTSRQHAGSERSTERSTSSPDVQRLLAFRKLTRSLGTYRPSKTTLNLYMPRSSGAPSRIPLFTPTLTPELAARIRASRARRLHSANNLASTSRNSNQLSPEELQASSSGSRSRLVDNEETERELAPPVAIDQSDDEAELFTTAAPAEVENNQAGNDVYDAHNSSAGGVSIEEEIVEIEAEPETTNAEEGNANNTSGENRETNESSPNISAEDLPHGVKRKREGTEESNENTSIKDFNQSLLRLLECPVCMESVEPPMWQCRRGHLVCGACRARLPACPVCRTGFSSVRNRAMEAVAELVRYPCRHACGRELRLRRRSGHEASCEARRHACPVVNCRALPLPRDQLAVHAKQAHAALVRAGRRQRVCARGAEREARDVWFVLAHRALFLLRLTVEPRARQLQLYVQYVGPRNRAHHYTYQVTVVGQHNSRKLVYTRTTHSDLESSSINITKQDCFHLTLDQALNFLRVKNRHSEPDKYLEFDVEINKVEVETLRDDSDS